MREGRKLPDIAAQPGHFVFRFPKIFVTVIVADGETPAVKGQFSTHLMPLKQPVQKGRFATAGRQVIRELLVMIGLVVRRPRVSPVRG